MLEIWGQSPAVLRRWWTDRKFRNRKANWISAKQSSRKKGQVNCPFLRNKEHKQIKGPSLSYL